MTRAYSPTWLVGVLLAQLGDDRARVLGEHGPDVVAVDVEADEVEAHLDGRTVREALELERGALELDDLEGVVGEPDLEGLEFGVVVVEDDELRADGELVQRERIGALDVRKDGHVRYSNGRDTITGVIVIVH